jgi:hypothetical protein
MSFIFTYIGTLNNFMAWWKTFSSHLLERVLYQTYFQDYWWKKVTGLQHKENLLVSNWIAYH